MSQSSLTEICIKNWSCDSIQKAQLPKLSWSRNPPDLCLYLKENLLPKCFVEQISYRPWLKYSDSVWAQNTNKAIPWLRHFRGLKVAKNNLSLLIKTGPVDHKRPKVHVGTFRTIQGFLESKVVFCVYLLVASVAWRRYWLCVYIFWS